MGGKGGQTVGYWYKFAILAGLGRGKSNGLLAIEADDKIAWVGDLSEDTPTKINKPNLFGGEKKEGGIQGAFRLFGGATDQVLPASTTVSVASSGPVKSIVLPNVQSAIGGRVSQLRRVETLWYRGTVSANNYYPKEWHFCRDRKSVV